MIEQMVEIGCEGQIGKKKFRKVVLRELYSYNAKEKFIKDDNCIMQKNNSDFLIFLTAIPFIGTIIILVYFMSRHEEVRYEEVYKDNKNGKEKRNR